MEPSLRDLNWNFCELYILRLGVSGGGPGPGGLGESARLRKAKKPAHLVELGSLIWSLPYSGYFQKTLCELPENESENSVHSLF